jgi:ferric-dicitrate binding protein FerR (iron transport regulator)
MDPNDLPTAPATRASGFRRTVLTAGMAAALLIAGGAAVVSAASPVPSASPTPVATSGGDRHDCPNADGTDDGTSSATPTPTPTPAS